MHKKTNRKHEEYTEVEQVAPNSLTDIVLGEINCTRTNPFHCTSTEFLTQLLLIFKTDER